tara:strand:- start:1172 stop:1399 length:228 start_codon:yes stop_codon:yes gene_type:complete
MTDDGKAKVNVNVDEMTKVLKTYKKLKKYMKSNLYEIRNLNGTDDTISKLLKDYGPDKSFTQEKEDDSAECEGGE